MPDPNNPTEGKPEDELPANVASDNGKDKAEADKLKKLEEFDPASVGPTRLRDALPERKFDPPEGVTPAEDTGPKDPAPGPRPKIRGNEALPIEGKYAPPGRRGEPRRNMMKIPDEHDVVFEGKIIGRHPDPKERQNIIKNYGKRGGPSVEPA